MTVYAAVIAVTKDLPDVKVRPPRPHTYRHAHEHNTR